MVLYSPRTVYPANVISLLEHSNMCAGLRELPGITQNWVELGVPRETLCVTPPDLTFLMI